MISAKIIADSISPVGKRITTMCLEYPRFIHAEFMTHRLFSRNASSSRAIPVEKMLKRVREDPAMPVYWGKNQKGMQASEELTGEALELARAEWLFARNRVVESVETLHRFGLHKQTANRLLEPWMHIAVVCTATEWGNWFNLRNHEAAQPEIQVLAQKMWEALESSSPECLEVGEWHLPYIGLRDWARDADPGEPLDIKFLKQMSAARCARVSYFNHEGQDPTLVEDFQLFDRLMGGFPKHASPTEHQATPLHDPEERSGNFLGWQQFRKSIPGEYLPEYRGLK